jgi:chromosome segregation ATPase
MAVTALEVILPAVSSIITAAGTIITLRWQEETKRKQHERENQITMLDKVDELVDERLAESRADRAEMKGQLRQAEKERKRLAEEQISLKEANAVLRSQISEIQLHREQAINRMRQELNALGDKNTVLLAQNVELETQLTALQRENQQLRQQLADVRQQ